MYLILQLIYIFLESIQIFGKEIEVQSAQLRTQYIINVCHVRLGHRCIGCYIRQTFVLTSRGCAWTSSRFRNIRLVADNPTLNCLEGQYRKAIAIYFEPITEEHWYHGSALVKLEFPFIRSTHVGLIHVTHPTAYYRKCSVFKCDNDVAYASFRIRSILADIVDISECNSLIEYSYFIRKETVMCARSKERLTYAETVKFAGISPLICENSVKGFVIAANGTILCVHRLREDVAWIEMISRIGLMNDSNKIRCRIVIVFICLLIGNKIALHCFIFFELDSLI